jgi:hypothetical protein
MIGIAKPLIVLNLFSSLLHFWSKDLKKSSSEYRKCSLTKNIITKQIDPNLKIEADRMSASPDKFTTVRTRNC